jgi:hypothetical protein
MPESAGVMSCIFWFSPKSVGSIHNSTFMENEIEELLA